MLGSGAVSFYTCCRKRPTFYCSVAEYTVHLAMVVIAIPDAELAAPIPLQQLVSEPRISPEFP